MRGEWLLTKSTDPRQKHGAIAHERAKLVVAAETNPRPVFLQHARLVRSVRVQVAQQADAVPLILLGMERIVAERGGDARNGIVVLVVEAASHVGSRTSLQTPVASRAGR